MKKTKKLFEIKIYKNDKKYVYKEKKKIKNNQWLKIDWNNFFQKKKKKYLCVKFEREVELLADYSMA